MAGTTTKVALIARLRSSAASAAAHHPSQRGEFHTSSLAHERASVTGARIMEE